MEQLEKDLRELNIRIGGSFTLHSGIQSNVKWDIEKLFDYPQWLITQLLRDWIKLIAYHRPTHLIGIQTGGWLLAKLIASPQVLNITSDFRLSSHNKSKRIIAIDDVLTTGNTINGFISNDIISYAVLINRSASPILTKVDNKPLITGLFADPISKYENTNKSQQSITH